MLNLSARTSSSAAGSRRSVACRATPDARPSRRSTLLGGGALLVATAASGSAAWAKDLNEAKAANEARKKRLREAAERAEKTGTGPGQVFEAPEESLSEESRSPEFRMRLSEGSRIAEKGSSSKD